MVHADVAYCLHKFASVDSVQTVICLTATGNYKCHQQSWHHLPLSQPAQFVFSVLAVETDDCGEPTPLSSDVFNFIEMLPEDYYCSIIAIDRATPDTLLWKPLLI